MDRTYHTFYSCGTDDDYYYYYIYVLLLSHVFGHFRTARAYTRASTRGTFVYVLGQRITGASFAEFSSSCAASLVWYSRKWIRDVPRNKSDARARPRARFLATTRLLYIYACTNIIWNHEYICIRALLDLTRYISIYSHQILFTQKPRVCVCVCIAPPPLSQRLLSIYSLSHEHRKKSVKSLHTPV